MKIILDEQYFVTTDALNYILKKKVTSKDQKTYDSSIGYFGKNKRGLRQLAQKYILDKQDENLADLEIKADEIVSRIIRSNIQTAETVAKMIEKTEK